MSCVLQAAAYSRSHRVTENRHGEALPDKAPYYHRGSAAMCVVETLELLDGAGGCCGGKEAKVIKIINKRNPGYIEISIVFIIIMFPVCCRWRNELLCDARHGEEGTKIVTTQVDGVKGPRYNLCPLYRSVGVKTNKVFALVNELSTTTLPGYISTPPLKKNKTNPTPVVK